jgi:hypothetical protein
MKIEYSPAIPPALLPVIQPAVDSVSHLFPRWCEKLTVYYDTDGEADTIASCHPLPEYRTMSIHIRPPFFDESDGGLNALLHEIGHGLIRPLSGRFRRIVERLSPNETVSALIMDELDEAEEGVCEDIAVFAKKLKENGRHF